MYAVYWHSQQIYICVFKVLIDILGQICHTVMYLVDFFKYPVCINILNTIIL